MSNFLNQVSAIFPGAASSVISTLRNVQLGGQAGLNVSPNINFTPLTIGGFNLTGFEAPEHINVGGQQKLAVHDFPGGTRTVQSLGAFPPDEISWEGLFIGPTAWDRAYALDRFRVDGSDLSLLYGNWGYNGKIKHLELIAVNQWVCRYKLYFIPYTDLAQAPQPPTQNSSAVVNGAMSNLSGNIPTTQFGDTLPTSVLTPVNSLMSTVTTAMARASNVFQNIATSDIRAITTYVGQTVSSVAAIVSDPSTPLSMSASALYVGNQASIIGAQTSVPPTPQSVVTVNNPNLMQMAAQYYGDSSLWPKIASANGLVDPMPTGQFSLMVPQ